MLAECQRDLTDEQVEVQRDQEVASMTRAGVEPASGKVVEVEKGRSS